VALRYLTREDDGKELRERIDARVEELLAEPASQSAPAEVLQGLKQDVARLKRRLDGQGEDLPSTRTQANDARRFLRKLRSALAEQDRSAALSTYR
jgi:hypothetical protein